EYYGARWKIESGFKELKQEIGSCKSQCRNAQAVTNHLNFWLFSRICG
ncbi:transposase, partial [Thiolapillus sp.]